MMGKLFNETVEQAPGQFIAKGQFHFINAKQRDLKCQIMAFKFQKWRLTLKFCEVS